jgi:hypothetical protein
MKVIWLLPPVASYQPPAIDEASKKDKTKTQNGKAKTLDVRLWTFQPPAARLQPRRGQQKT